MAEYIERQKLLDSIFHRLGIKKSERWLLPAERVLYDEVKKAPAADVVEVIRCRDCRYNLGENKCLYPDSIIKIPDDNDYCSYGRRRLNHDRTGQELQALRKEIQSK